MSYLKKLMIKGVRSFDPQRDEVIEFYSPLTVILGPNGAGKTTIIEALRYVTTGECPPNSNRGKTFVHDPSIAKTNTVRGQVKLKFHDVGNENTIVTRSLEVTMKRTAKGLQMSSKTLDGVIKRGSNTIDSRCAVIDTEMLDLIGVSKAVLTNVIFCHQEDSNWPLSEGKILKEKFDDIFGSIYYVKALDKIRKLRKSEKDDERILNSHVELAKEHKRQLDNHVNKNEKLRRELNILKQDNNHYDEILGKVSQELNAIKDKENVVQVIQNKISTLTGTIEEKEKICKDIRSGIKHLFQGSEDELKSQIGNFDENLQTKVQERLSLIQQQNEIKTGLENKMMEQRLILQEFGKLEEIQSQYSKLINEKQEMAMALFCDYQINNYLPNDLPDRLNEDQMNQVEEMLKKHVDKLQQKIQYENSTFNTNNKKFQNDLDQINKMKNRLEDGIERSNDELRKKQTALNELTRKIDLLNSSTERYNTLKNDINECNKELEKMNKVNIKDIQSKIKERELKKQKFKSDLDEIDESIVKANQENEIRIKNRLQLEIKEKKEEEINKIKANHESIMEGIGVEGDNVFKKPLESHIRTKEMLKNKKSSELTGKERQLYELQTSLKNENDLLMKKEAELKEIQLKIKNCCGDKDFGSYFKQTEDELKGLRELCSNLESSKSFYEIQIQNIKKNKCCPICDHDLSHDWTSKDGIKLDQNKVIKNLENCISKLPAETIQKNELLKQKEDLYKNLMSLKPIRDNIQNMQDEIFTLKSAIDSKSKNIGNLQKEIQKLKKDFEERQTELDHLVKLLPIATEYDSYLEIIKKIDYEISQTAWKISSDDINIEQLNNQKKLIQQEIEMIDSENNKDHVKIRDHSDRINKIQIAKQTAENEKLRIERDQNDKINDENKQKELLEEIDNLNRKIIDYSEQLKNLIPQLKHLQYKKEQCSLAFENCQNEISTDISCYEEKLNGFKRICERIEEYIESGKLNHSKEIKKKYQRINEEVKNIEIQIGSSNEKMNKISEEISNHEVTKRELIDNLKYFNYQTQMSELKDCLEKEQQQLGFHDIFQLENKKQKLEKEEREIMNEKQQSIGKQKPIIDEIKEIEQILKDPKYKNAKANYREKLIDLATCEIAGEDLNKYYKALDYAVTTFHQRKMQEINKLIKGFWKQAYRGQDIDYIKIVSDEEEERTTDKRRSYNYRVVMVKDNTEMDMRGRCSAGQKVLASLIIRLALAEIFCANCSVLALDEPTTNLDKNNISSFASAISDIVKYRSRSTDTKFQLIIITHDEEFLGCLNEDTGLYYFKVSKNSNGYSLIHRKTIKRATNRDDEEEEDD